MSRVEQFLLGGGHNRTAIHVGLVNNMPDAALRATELQFARLLKASAGPLDVRLRLFSLRSIPRSEETRSRMAGFYDDAGFLQAANIDALIVTGAQPGAADLRDEPYWAELAHLIDWAEIGTISTLFSDLAAHAAVLHLDGIARRPLAKKLSGVYDSTRVEDDPLFFNTTPAVPVPHSRRNDIAESDLAAKGYRVLSRLNFNDGSRGQADIFTREPPGQSRFVFFQGHPEYDPGTLGREYLRDMGRFLRGESAERPALPENYFDRATEGQLTEMAGETDLARFDEIVVSALPRQMWRNNTIKLFGNWLTLVAAAKARRAASRSVHTRRRA
ncbi:MAG: homoserine O-succinyltransferase [Alphaproteobacteria bacterium]|nr:homoserine O-succinyltransferase [Alphaproteobacteria bacterium]